MNEPSPDLWKIFNGVSTLSPAEAWEVGYRTASDENGDPKGPSIPLAAHWNGSKWRIKNPPRYATSHTLNAVAESSPTNVWAVGDRYTTAEAERTLIDQWTGSGWVDVGGPNVGTGDNELDAVIRVPGETTFWAVGHSPSGALILRNWIRGRRVARIRSAAGVEPSAMAACMSSAGTTPRPPAPLRARLSRRDVLSWRPPRARPSPLGVITFGCRLSRPWPPRRALPRASWARARQSRRFARRCLRWRCSSCR